MHAPVLVAAPAEALISLAEARQQCQVDPEVTEFDTMLDLLVAAATTHVDGYAGILGRALVTQTWRQDFDGFCSRLRLPLPAAAITSVKWYDDEATPTETTIASTNYELQHDALGSFVRFVDAYSFPSDLAETRAVRVTFTAGYGAAAAVPAAIKQALLLLVGHWFMNREAVNIGNITSAVPFAVDALLGPYRRVGV